MNAYKAAHPEITDAEIVKIPISELYATYAAAQTPNESTVEQTQNTV
jgi:hypothetical protein